MHPKDGKKDILNELFGQKKSKLKKTGNHINRKKEKRKEPERMTRSTKAENMELNNLKKKCNGLLDLVERLKNEKSKLEIELERSKRASILHERAVEKSELEKYISDFEYVVKKSDELGAFIPYTYSSKYAKSFVKIESVRLEEIIKMTTSMDVENFISIGAKMQLLSRKPVSWNGKKSYLLSKSACEFMLGEKSKLQDDQEVIYK